MNKKLVLLLAAVLIGVVNALVFKVFEFLVHEGTEYLWNDVLHSDTKRWLVLPLTIGFGVVFAFVLRLLKQPRLPEPEIDPLQESPGDKPKVTLGTMGKILTSGVVSLMAGASLGPEAALTENSKAMGAWAAGKTKAGPAGPLLLLSSLGALMVAFLGSLWMAFLPVLILYQKTKKLTIPTLLPIILASLSAYGTLLIVDHADLGFSDIPPLPAADVGDYLSAVLVGFVVAGAAFGLKRLIMRFYWVAKKIDRKFPWYVSAGVFGAVIGVLYLVGGPTVQFSGSSGSAMLIENQAMYGAWAFLGFALIKLLATAWSKAAGYHGGLVFPSLYMGIALGLFVGALVAPLEGPGAMIGAIGGIFAAVVGSAPVAFLFLIAILPFNLMGVAVAAIIAATLGNRILGKRLA